MGGDFDWLKKAVTDGVVSDRELRFFVGYAGWTSGQLADEIKSKSWFVAEASIKTIMDTKTERTIIGRDSSGAWGAITRTLPMPRAIPA